MVSKDGIHGWEESKPEDRSFYAAFHDPLFNSESQSDLKSGDLRHDPKSGDTVRCLVLDGTVGPIKDRVTEAMITCIGIDCILITTAPSKFKDGEIVEMQPKLPWFRVEDARAIGALGYGKMDKDDNSYKPDGNYPAAGFVNKFTTSNDFARDEDYYREEERRINALGDMADKAFFVPAGSKSEEMKKAEDALSLSKMFPMGESEKKLVDEMQKKHDRDVFWPELNEIQPKTIEEAFEDKINGHERRTEHGHR